MERPLDQAMAFASALELMSFGPSNIEQDYATAIATTAQALSSELEELKVIWRRMLGGSATLVKRGRL